MLSHKVFASTGAVPSLRELKPKPLRYVFILPTRSKKLRCAVVFSRRSGQKMLLFHATVHKKKGKGYKKSYLYVFRSRVLALRSPVGSDRQGKEPT